MLVVLRINRNFMEYMKQEHPELIEKFKFNNRQKQDGNTVNL
jgi:hypothetical protein